MQELVKKLPADQQNRGMEIAKEISKTPKQQQETERKNAISVMNGRFGQIYISRSVTFQLQYGSFYNMIAEFEKESPELQKIKSWSDIPEDLRKTLMSGVESYIKTMNPKNKDAKFKISINPDDRSLGNVLIRPDSRAEFKIENGKPVISYSVYIQ